MSARTRSKFRRREFSSYRYDHQMFGDVRTTPPHATSSGAGSRIANDGPHHPASPRRHLLETRPTLRLEGDSIAYFWALETETTIAYETLTAHWRDFVEVLVAPSWPVRSLRPIKLDVDCSSAIRDYA